MPHLMKTLPNKKQNYGNMHFIKKEVVPRKISQLAPFTRWSKKLSRTKLISTDF